MKTLWTKNVVDGLMWNGAKKPLAIALSGLGRAVRGRDEGHVNNV
jgi:hypothetical protein